jgi:anti-anti-sigma factor
MSAMTMSGTRHRARAYRRPARRRRAADRPALEVRLLGVADDVVRVVVAGELDVGTEGRVLAAVRELRAAGRTVTFDLSRVTFIDCTGLRRLLEIQADADRDGWNVTFDPNVPAQVARVLDLTRRRAALHWSG